MPRARPLLVMVLALSMFVVVATPVSASASVPSKNTAFCKAIDKIFSTGGGQPTKQQAEVALTSVASAAKHSPSNVKKALKTLVSEIQQLAKAGSASARAKIYTNKKYAKAVLTVENYSNKTC